MGATPPRPDAPSIGDTQTLNLWNLNTGLLLRGSAALYVPVLRV